MCTELSLFFIVSSFYVKSEKVHNAFHAQIFIDSVIAGKVANRVLFKVSISLLFSRSLTLELLRGLLATYFQALYWIPIPVGASNIRATFPEIKRVNSHSRLR